MRELGQQRSEILSWKITTLHSTLVVLHTMRAREARERGEMYKAFGPLAALFGGK